VLLLIGIDPWQQVRRHTAVSRYEEREKKNCASAIPPTASHMHPCPGAGEAIRRGCGILTISRKSGFPAKKTRKQCQNGTNLSDLRCLLSNVAVHGVHQPTSDWGRMQPCFGYPADHIAGVRGGSEQAGVVPADPSAIMGTLTPYSVGYRYLTTPPAANISPGTIAPTCR
jgi:hypothetical protein